MASDWQHHIHNLLKKLESPRALECTYAGSYISAQASSQMWVYVAAISSRELQWSNRCGLDNKGLPVYINMTGLLLHIEQLVTVV